MRRRALRMLAVSATLGLAAPLVLPAPPALAVRDEPLVLVTAWYWEDQQRQKITDPTSGTDVAVISAPNPFCPSPPLTGSPPEQTCKPGRLPVQVRDGDYETPNQLSAVGFDFALVAPGSKIGKFTVTFLEAKDDQSRPVNAEGKSLRACFVEEFFGDGEASMYNQAPKYTCSESDPVAKRKEIKVKEEEGGGGGEDPQPPEQETPTYGYTFDLTEFARSWVEDPPPMTAVMLTPVRPKEADYEPTTDANWRTVLVGNIDEGIKTSLTYTPPPTPPTVAPTPPVDTGFDSGTDTTTTTTGSGDIPTSTGTVDGGTAPSDTGTTADTPTDLAGEETAPTGATVPKGWPGYVWLGILAGIVGLSMVRSVVLERTVGIRPDGVLAQIRRLNASRRGVELAAADGAAAAGAGGAIASVVAGLKSLGERTGGIAGKLNFRKKGS
ncbi:MAG TPA: hypothetical protein VHN37_07900 [Actinomycetota bacterium]|nr:hypothetical protein [Actinomycetota bacterium]